MFAMADLLSLNIYSTYMSKKSWPILYSNLLYKMGQDYSDMQFLYSDTYCYGQNDGGWERRCGGGRHHRDYLGIQVPPTLSRDI